MYPNDEKERVNPFRFTMYIMIKKPIATAQAPSAIGPYSQAVDTGNMIFVSGQIPIDPATGQFVLGGVAEQTRQCLTNVKAVLAAGGYTMDQVVKASVFLQDMNTFTDMNNVYAEFFTEPYPARAAVEVARLPKDALVEIEVIAVK